MLVFLSFLAKSNLVCDETETVGDKIIRTYPDIPLNKVRCYQNHAKTLYFFNSVHSVDIEFCTTDDKGVDQKCITATPDKPIVSYVFPNSGKLKIRPQNDTFKIGLHIFPIDLCEKINISTKAMHRFDPFDPVCMISGGIPDVSVTYFNSGSSNTDVAYIDENLRESKIAAQAVLKDQKIRGYYQLSNMYLGFHAYAASSGSDINVVYQGEVNMNGPTYISEYDPKIDDDTDNNKSPKRSFSAVTLMIIIIASVAFVVAGIGLVLFFLTRQSKKYYTEIPNEKF